MLAALIRRRWYGTSLTDSAVTNYKEKNQWLKKQKRFVVKILKMCFNILLQNKILWLSNDCEIIIPFTKYIFKNLWLCRILNNIIKYSAKKVPNLKGWLRYLLKGIWPSFFLGPKIWGRFTRCYSEFIFWEIYGSFASFSTVPAGLKVEGVEPLCDERLVSFAFSFCVLPMDVSDFRLIGLAYQGKDIVFRFII